MWKNITFRIQDFQQCLEEGHQTLRWERQAIILSIFSQKLHEIEKIESRVRHVPSAPPLQ